MARILLVLLIIIFCGCDKNKSSTTSDMEIIQDTVLVTKSDIQKINFTEFILDPKFEKSLNWLKFKEMETRIQELKNGDLSHFNSDTKIVETALNEFTNTLPLHLREEAIESRILIVKTMYLRLYNIVNISTSSKENIKKAIEDLLESFSNLTYQINKKFERDSQKVSKPD
ncbi:MAG: hypothetical protein HKO81_10395 [Flavobacteriaceae bacterium]|nr:hypothetical protein [Flavobacteriaceae bacterium]